MDFYILNKVSTFLEGLPNLNLEYLSMVDSVEQVRIGPSAARARHNSKH